MATCVVARTEITTANDKILSPAVPARRWPTHASAFAECAWSCALDPTPWNVQYMVTKSRPVSATPSTAPFPGFLSGA